MEYIKRIRAKVGHERILIPASAVVVLNESDCVLLHLRNDTNSWGLPGGLMDIGETAKESAAREVFEETGLIIKTMELFGIFSGPKFEARYPNGDETSPVVLGFVSKEFSGVMSESDESLKVQFFPLTNLPKNMNQFHQWFLEGYLEYRKGGSLRPVIV